MHILPILLIILFAAPTLAILLTMLTRHPRVAEWASVLASIVDFIVSIPILICAWNGPYIYIDRYIRLDLLGAWVILCVAVVYMLSSIYAVGYMRLLKEDDRLPVFYALFSGFALTMLLACVMNNAGVYWITIELTTLVSTFLVGFEQEAESTEAAWKYIVVVSAGLALSLLGTVFFYWGGTFVVGPSYAMTWDVLRQNAPHVSPPLLVVAFLLVLVGYGTKAGLAPMHTWLPDAHSESPAPVSAMLSGALLNTAIAGIARYLGVVNNTSVRFFAHSAVVAFGIFSFAIAAFFILRQKGIKRLMAYSSVEHISVQAMGFGFGGVFGVAGALYHMINHSLNKSLMFFGAGNAMRGYGTKEIANIRGVLKASPVSGMLWLLGAVGIAGAPPFALFLSEYTVLRAGVHGPYLWAAILFMLLLIVIFIGFLAHFRAMYFDPSPAAEELPRLGYVVWRVLPMWLAFVPLLVMGLWWPHIFWEIFGRISQALWGGAQ